MVGGQTVGTAEVVLERGSRTDAELREALHAPGVKSQDGTFNDCQDAVWWMISSFEQAKREARAQVESREKAERKLMAQAELAKSASARLRSRASALLQKVAKGKLDNDERHGERANIDTP